MLVFDFKLKEKKKKKKYLSSSLGNHSSYLEGWVIFLFLLFVFGS